MASSRFHKAKQRRAEMAPLMRHTSINLVPLIDILTSVVFFSLLTYTGAVMASLTAFDLSLPPVVVTADQARANAGQKDTLTLLLAVKIQDGNLRVEHSGGLGGQPFLHEIAGVSPQALDELQRTLSGIKQEFPDNNDLLVVPDDNVSYEDIVHVLERVKLARFSGISLSNRARATQVASAGGG